MTTSQRAIKPTKNWPRWAKPPNHRCASEYASQPGAEARQRLEDLLGKLAEPAKVRERLRRVPVAAKSWKKSAAPKQEASWPLFAQGGPDFAITQDAKGTLERLERARISLEDRVGR